MKTAQTMWSVRSLASSYTSKHRFRVASFSSVFHALFTTSKADWARSLSSWFLSGCTKIDKLRYRFFIRSIGVSGSICSTSNGFKLKYVDPERNRRLICCSDVSTESLASICLTYSMSACNERVCECVSTSIVCRRVNLSVNWKTSNWFYLRIETIEFIWARWTTRRHYCSVLYHFLRKHYVYNEPASKTASRWKRASNDFSFTT